MSIIRDITLTAEKYLNNDQILLFIGARQAGKTTILKQLQDIVKKKFTTYFFLNLEDSDTLGLLNDSAKNLFKIIPINLNKKNILFIDEIQYLKNPTNFLKYYFDEYKEKIKIIASGSSAFYIDRNFKDSLVGRKKIFNVYTLSFREFLRFKKEEDLSIKNFSRITITEKEKIQLYLLEYITFGGYPRVVLSELDDKKDILHDIIYSYIKKDVYEAGIRSDEIFYRLLKLLSQQVGNLVNALELANMLGVSKTSVENYLYVMQKSFHIQLIRPFYKNIRKEITKMPKIFFYDIGLRNALINNYESLEFRLDKGQILENLMFRALLEKNKVEDIKFWRTIDQSEVDFVIGNTAYEVKTKRELIKMSKYKFFSNKYPKIKLNIVDFESILNLL
jgi:uncharacterized protein